MSETTPIIRRDGIIPPVPDDRSQVQKQRAVFIILGCTVLERLAFYSLTLNLVVNLQSSALNWASSSSTTLSLIFFGISYISAIIFSALSDARFGRANTIRFGFILYILGYILIILITNSGTYTWICRIGSETGQYGSILHEHCGPLITGTLVIIAMAVGAVQANIAVFGAEQTQRFKIEAHYFDRYYMAVNIGAVIATLFVPLVQIDSDDPSNGNNYFYGYLIGFLMLIGAASLFVTGKQYFLHIPPTGTVITKIFPVITVAFKRWRLFRKNKAIERRNRLTLMSNRDNLIEEAPTFHEQSSSSSSFLDFAKNSGEFQDRIVNDVKSLFQAIFVFFLLIPYWLIYHQIQITFPLQGKQMKNGTFPGGKSVPYSWMSLGDSLTVLFGLIILIGFVYKRSNHLLSIKTKIIIGMGLASLSVFIAGIVEIARQEQCLEISTSSQLIIYAQIPQNIFMGLAEMFATVAIFDFAHLASPRSGQSLFMSLLFGSVGFSSFVAIGYLSVYPTGGQQFDFRCDNDGEKWTYSAYFFILAGLQLAFIGIIALCDQFYHIFQLHPQQVESERHLQDN